MTTDRPDPATPDADADADDPVLARRRLIARWVAIGKRVGYSALLVAIVVFAIGLVAGFPDWTVTVVVVALVVAIVVLPAPIVFGYGIKAAEREERGGGSFH